MCAIFGVLGEFDEGIAKYALSTMLHRGPDYCGIEQKQNLFFAHQRLSITDIHSRSHQPLKHNNILLSFNGEIYNYKELRQKLHFNFQTQSDTEVILAAYLEWGEEFVKHLRGMFAIALLDGNKLYLFRDRLGKKPLFYMQQSNFFAFASEIKALKPFLKQTKLNNDALLSYLSFLAPTPPHTFYQKIQKLSAGEYLVFENNKMEKKHYFELLEQTPNKHQTHSILTPLLEEAIALRLDSDAPMASLLSGGIDSAILNYYAKRFNKPLMSYTLGYSEFAKYDERENAKESAKLLGVQNKQIEITQNDFIEATYKVLDTLDEPLNDPASIPLYLLFEQIKKDGYKVVLSGEGSDELFLGYRQYFEYLDIQKASILMHKNWLKKYFRANFSMNREWEWYKRVFDESLLFRTSGEKFSDLQKNHLLKQNVRDNQALTYLKPYRERFENSAFEDESFWYSYIDLHLFQAEHFLTKLDRVSMAHSIESRTPFLDHKLVEAVFTLEANLRYKNGVTKDILKQMMQGKIDTTILTRKKKGFSNPYMEYLFNSGEISLITEVNEQTGMFKKDMLERYMQSGKKGRFKQHLFGLFVLSYWIKRNLL